MSGTVTVRIQKIKKNTVKGRLIFFLILAVILLLVTIFADRIVPYDPYAQDLSKSMMPPSAEHLMGTDRYGRDMFSRVIVGAQVSILVFALAIAALLGGGVGNAVIALAVISWPKYARVARSQKLALKNVPFVLAARLSGCTSLQIILRHILPNILGPILVTAMLDIGTMMMELAGLSFLGLGAQPPTDEWGNMMSGGRSMLQTYPWLVLSPGLAIFVTVVIFNLLGDTVRDYMDPKNSRAR